MSPTAGSLLLGLVLCSVGIWAAVTPVKPVKTGVCPQNVDYPTCDVASFVPECNTDANCTGTKKCCYSGCRKRCLLPLKKVKNSFCPYASFLPDECHADDQCQGSDKCCKKCRSLCTPASEIGGPFLPVPSGNE
ncbi:porwaprin-b-like [Ascaphus truei]|uniref:porwaprin-b-like n=1 Tax=Ascaphus truei TaxID=8439 RepID=UPI003F5A3BB8